MSDEQLLIMYRKYKKKRRIIILFSLLILIVLLFLIKYFVYDISKKKGVVPEKIELDNISPEIKLITDKVELFQGESFDYMKYVENVIDNKDGDITKKIKHSMLDNSVIGEQE